MKESMRRFIRHWGPGLIFIITVVVYIFIEQTQLSIPYRDLMQHLLLVLAAVMGVHLLEHTWLRERMTELYRKSLIEALQNSNLIIESSASSGLKNIYPSRDVETLKKDIIKGIENVKSKVWILGVGLSEKISLKTDLLPKLKPIVKKVDVKILLLDALRSPAVFRTFLESSAEQFKGILDTDRSEPPPLDPYFEHRLYDDFETSYKALKELRDFQSIVRFYAHNPSCWLIIVDDTAYFQPYTFGQGFNNDPDNLTIGPSMPVFQFKYEANMKPFLILEDHFNKLWLTSDADLFHIAGRVADRERIVKMIFEHRKEWFEHVYNGLHPSSRSEQRKYLRQLCDTNPRDVNVAWTKNNHDYNIEAEIVDFARDSVLLKVKKNDSKDIVDLTSTSKEEVKIVDLKITAKFNTRVANYFKEELIKPSKGKFKVTRITEDKSYFALQAYM